MREIKFRGKRKDDGKWIYGFYWYIEEHVNSALSKRHAIKSENNGIDYEVIPETVGQYIGKLSFDYIELYTGDVVKWGHIRCVENPVRIAVIDQQPDIQFRCINMDAIFHLGNFIYENTERYLEKLGNIYDNPDLLERKAE